MGICGGAQLINVACGGTLIQDLKSDTINHEQVNPRNQTSHGVKISKNTQVPIIPIGFASSKFRQLKSWDSFLITKPFSKCVFVWGNSISIPKSCDEVEIENFKKILEDQINLCIYKAKKEIDA